MAGTFPMARESVAHVGVGTTMTCHADSNANPRAEGAATPGQSSGQRES